MSSLTTEVRDATGSQEQRVEAVVDAMSDPAVPSFACCRHHRFMLIVGCAVVVSAMVLRVPNKDRVELVGLKGIPMPSMWLSKSMFGIDCPDCGVTRSLLCFLQGNFADSLAFHRVGWVVAIAVLLQFPYRIWALARRQDYPQGRRVPAAFGYALVVLLIGNWVVGFFL